MRRKPPTGTLGDRIHAGITRLFGPRWVSAWLVARADALAPNRSATSYGLIAALMVVMTTSSTFYPHRDARGRYAPQPQSEDEVRLTHPVEDDLADSVDPLDRAHAALTSRSRELLVALSCDAAAVVRAAVAQNPDTTDEVLRLLGLDIDETVADAANHNLGESDEYRRRNRDWYEMLRGGLPGSRSAA